MATKYRDELDDLSRSKLEVLRHPPARSATTAARQRALYMAQVRKMPASQTAPRVLPWWASVVKPRTADKGYTPSHRKWRMPSARLVVSALEILLILFSSSFFAVYAAQDSIPSDSIYPVKLLAEDVRLGLTREDASKVDLALALTNTRLEEIVALQENGEPVEAPVIDRMQEHYQMALQAASVMPDPLLSEFLLEVQDTSHDQWSTVTTLAASAPEGSEEELIQAQQMLKQNEGLAKDGIKDPANFRETMRKKSGQKGSPNAPDTEGNAPVEPESQTPNFEKPAKNGQNDAPGKGPDDDPGKGSDDAPGPPLSNEPDVTPITTNPKGPAK